MPLRLPMLPRRALLTLALAGLALPACEQSTADFGERDLVAEVDGIFIGILADGEQVVIYACDGTDDGTGSGPTPTVFTWYFAQNDSGEFQATDGEGALLVGSFDDDGSASGILALADGVEHVFSATPASGDEGVYLAEEGDLKGSWVVIGAEVRGAVINRNTGDLISSAAFVPSSSSTIDVDGVTLTPTKQTIALF